MQSEEGEYLLKVAEAVYQSGWYTEACEFFFQARIANKVNHSSNMPVLVRKNLCQHGHSEAAAAELYLEAALAGDREVYGMLQGIDENIFMKSKQEAVAFILEYWKTE